MAAQQPGQSSAPQATIGSHSDKAPPSLSFRQPRHYLGFQKLHSSSFTTIFPAACSNISQLVSYRNLTAHQLDMSDSRRSRRPDSRQMWDESDRRDRNPPRDRERGRDSRDRGRDHGRDRGRDRRSYRSRSRDRRDKQQDRSMSPDKHRRERGGDRGRGGWDRRGGRDGGRRESPRRQDDKSDRDGYDRDGRCKQTNSPNLALEMLFLGQFHANR